MPLFTPTYIYLGNSSEYGFGLVNPNWDGATDAERDTTPAEANVLMNRTFDSADMQGVPIRANSTNVTNIMRGETPISYRIREYDENGDPTGNFVQHNQLYIGHAVVNITVNLQRETGSSVDYNTVNLRGVVIQMENGDLFVRPYYLDQSQWENTLGDWGIRSIHTNFLVTGLNPSNSNTDAYTNGMSGEAGFSPRFAGPVDQPVVCFTPGTLIDTPDGPRCVETLRSGDRVTTQDHGVQIIRWIGSRRLSLTVPGRDHLRPIRIAAGALGVNTPSRNLIVSPQHRILVRSRIAQKMFGTSEVLVAARQLLTLDGVSIDQHATEVTYIHFLLSAHEIVIANGTQTESLYTGPEAVKAVPAAALQEILMIFPQLRDADFRPAPARPLIPGHRARRMVARHVQNRRALVA